MNSTPLLSSFERLPNRLSTLLLAVLATALLVTLGARAETAPTSSATAARVLQTNLVSDLPGVAAVTDANLVNPWGISESVGSPFWVSDNGSGLSTLYPVTSSVSINPLVVNIPTPVGLTGGTPTGTVFNTGAGGGAFKLTGRTASGQLTTAPALFLFATEDGIIAGWNPSIDPTRAVLAVDNSGNNFTDPDPDQQTGAVYKGLAIATSATPIIAGDADSTALLYASNFRAGTIDVYDAKFHEVTPLPAGAFADPDLPARYAPFDVQVLDGKVYVTYARQDATGHDDRAGPHRGFVDVFNLDGNPGLPGGAVRLISRGPLDSPWGLAIAPQGFDIGPRGGDPVLLVGNFGDGRVNAFDATTGSELGGLDDPDGEPIQIDGLWALKVGNGTNGGAVDTVYFTAGPFDESHGLFGSLIAVAPGTPEGPAEAQWVTANTDIVELDKLRLAEDSSSGAPAAILRVDAHTLDSDLHELARLERALAKDDVDDASP